MIERSTGILCVVLTVGRTLRELETKSIMVNYNPEVSHCIFPLIADPKVLQSAESTTVCSLSEGFTLSTSYGHPLEHKTSFSLAPNLKIHDNANRPRCAFDS